MSEPIKVLRALTDDEVIACHDAAAEHTQGGVSFYLDQLRRREQVRAIEASNRLARAAVRLTVANTLLAIVGRRRRGAHGLTYVSWSATCGSSRLAAENLGTTTSPGH